MRLATAFVTLVFASCGFAASLENLRFENFAGSEDLPSLWARSVFQDEKGYVWIPTNNNLVRYDSQRFRTFIPNPDVKGAISTNKPVKVTSDSEGNLWIASPQGLDRFDYDTEQFENFPLLDPMGQSLSRSPNLFELMHDGRLLLGTLTGLYLFDPQSLAWSERLTGIGGPQRRVQDFARPVPSCYDKWRLELRR
jgi:ligand-binding sensor domain-containing protein|tara:strand:- start:9689 stop:10273 length:585 start_codon:yes stop_codon:yes gene_type:complete